MLPVIVSKRNDISSLSCLMANFSIFSKSVAEEIFCNRLTVNKSSFLLGGVMSLTAPGYWTCRPQSRFHDHIRDVVGLLRTEKESPV